MGENLVNHRFYFAAVKNILKVVNKEVGNTDCLNLTVFISFLQRAPDLFVFSKIAALAAKLRPRLRTMYNHQIHIVHS